MFNLYSKLSTAFLVFAMFFSLGLNAQCVDTNYDENGAEITDGYDGCADYVASWCGNYDTLTFDSMEMCCICGGGDDGSAPSSCDDVAACNYGAAEDCTYADAGFDCNGDCLVGSSVTITLTDSWGDTWNGGTLTVDGVVYTQPTTGPSSTGASDVYTVCLDLSQCINVTYTAGSFAGENTWSISDASGELASGAGASGSGSSLFGGCVTACGDATANNYNADADIIDNS